MKLWLDDIRPAPPGWIHVKTIEEAKLRLLTGEVRVASLDHDLGACDVCLNGKTPEQWLVESGMTSMPHCEHFGTGYDLVCWMERTGYWPEDQCFVHSANPAGRLKMQLAIDREWEKRK